MKLIKAGVSTHQAGRPLAGEGLGVRVQLKPRHLHWGGGPVGGSGRGAEVC